MLTWLDNSSRTGTMRFARAAELNKTEEDETRRKARSRRAESTSFRFAQITIDLKEKRAQCQRSIGVEGWTPASTAGHRRRFENACELHVMESGVDGTEGAAEGAAKGSIFCRKAVTAHTGDRIARPVSAMKDPASFAGFDDRGLGCAAERTAFRRAAGGNERDEICDFGVVERVIWHRALIKLVE